nr:hypothetical protein ELOWGMBK_ELOWGMBK_CDS_0017 [Herelleviridae sp.]CAI9751976.1 hypothetical protein QGKEIAJE_QGKEIAJE_CDS_0016 [uncultured phage]
MNFLKVLKLKAMLAATVAIETDKGTLYVENELAEGIAIFIEKEGDFVSPEDGDYLLKDGRALRVVEGKVESITEPVIEETVELEDQPDEKDLRIAELEGLLKDRDAVIEELTQKIKELEDKNQAPVEEAVKMSAVADEGKYSFVSKFLK